MNDIATVFGILLAVYTYTDTIVSVEVEKCRQETRNPKAMNNRKAILQFESTLKRKVIPLQILNFVIIVFMVPDFKKVVLNTIGYFSSNGTYQYSVGCATVLLITTILVFQGFSIYRTRVEFKESIKLFSQDMFL